MKCQGRVIKLSTESNPIERTASKQSLQHFFHANWCHIPQRIMGSVFHIIGLSTKTLLRAQLLSLQTGRKTGTPLLKVYQNDETEEQELKELLQKILKRYLCRRLLEPIIKAK